MVARYLPLVVVALARLAHAQPAEPAPPVEPTTGSTAASHPHDRHRGLSVGVD
jgi:hypothetical protein